MGIHVDGEAGRLIWPLFNPTKREVSQALWGGHPEGGSPNRNLEEGREGNELQIELSASRICRSTGAKTNVAASDPHSE